MIYGGQCKLYFLQKYSEGWSDFQKLKATYSVLCQIVVGPQFQNYMTLMLSLSLGAGPLKIWTVTLK